MNEDPKQQDKAAPTSIGQGDPQDRSPARSKDRLRPEAREQNRTGSQTEEIDGAQADEDTYD